MHHAAAGSPCAMAAGAPLSAAPVPVPHASCGASGRAVAHAAGCATGCAMQRAGVLSLARAQAPPPAEEPPQKRGPRGKKQAARAAAKPPGEDLAASEARPRQSGARALCGRTLRPAARERASDRPGSRAAVRDGCLLSEALACHGAAFSAGVRWLPSSLWSCVVLRGGPQTAPPPLVAWHTCQ